MTFEAEIVVELYSLIECKLQEVLFHFLIFVEYLLSVALEPCLADGAAFRTFGVTTRSSYCGILFNIPLYHLSAAPPQKNVVIIWG